MDTIKSQPFVKETIKILKEFKELNYPKSKRRVYESIAKFVNFPTYIIRKRWAEQVIINDNNLPDIPLEDGFLVWKPDNFESLELAIEAAKERLLQADLNGLLANAQGKHKYLLALGIKHELSLDSPLLKLACHPSLVSIVTKYIGILPILNSVNILYSPNQDFHEESAQMLHLDPEGVRQVKVFIYLEDVSEESGPLTLIPVRESQKLYPIYKGGRLRDEFVSKFVAKDDIKTIIEPAKTMIFADTSSCFHFGSRPGKKARFVILFQYITPFSQIFPLFGWKRKARLVHLIDKDSPSLVKYLLGAR